MPPAFALSQDQTLKFINPTKPSSSAKPMLIDQSSAHHSRHIPHEHSATHASQHVKPRPHRKIFIFQKTDAIVREQTRSNQAPVPHLYSRASLSVKPNTWKYSVLSGEEPEVPCGSGDVAPGAGGCKRLFGGGARISHEADTRRATQADRGAGRRCVARQRRRSASASARCRRICRAARSRSPACKVSRMARCSRTETTTRSGPRRQE